MGRGGGFEIWQARDRIHSLDNPVRLDILRFLEDGPKTLNELVAHTGKAKSTLSALHVPPLLDGRLIEEVPDPRDARIKTYRLVGSRLAQSDIEPRKLRDAVLDYVRDNGVVPLDSLMRLLDLPALLQSGANPDYLRGVAQRAGRMFAPLLTGETRDAGARELRVVLHRHGLDGLKEGGRKSAVGAFAAWLIEAALEARYAEPAARTVRLQDLA
ncbi:MAG: winged helix-turn-helix transcriptional regulator [Euryarchaeota archaeon]|nr:winged helix-turn-helix transcriptional regulator [Euryarchaeota archaeon]